MITKEVLDVCPFDLDEPSKLWTLNVHAMVPCWHPLYTSARNVLVRCLSEKDSWEYRARLGDCIVETYGDPEQTTLNESLDMARRLGRDLLIKSATGRIIEEYPL
jgi:hypothetical protein